MVARPGGPDSTEEKTMSTTRKLELGTEVRSIALCTACGVALEDASETACYQHGGVAQTADEAWRILLDRIETSTGEVSTQFLTKSLLDARNGDFLTRNVL